MADKLILNADLNYKTAEFTPEKYTVEKVIEVSETEFRKFYEKPMKPNYYLSTYKDLMGFYDESYHCVLLINEQNGDGLLINSEGANYARYSQYIPNARGIIRQHEQTAAFDALKTHMDCCIDKWLEQHTKENQFGIPLTDLIDESNFADKLVDHVSERLSSDPRIEACELTHNSIEVTKRELVETRLYSPLTFRTESEDFCCDLDEVDSANYIDYDDEINAKLRAELNLDDDAVERGLAAYLDRSPLYDKVYSIMPKVETRNGELYGMTVVKSYGELDRAEMIELAQYLTGQYADGFGEGFEQREIRLGGDEVFISFWNDDDYFLKPESEVFPEQKFEQTMGGIKMAENTIEMKFRCPLEFVVEPEDVESDCYEVSARHFAEYADEINKLIIESFGIYDPNECGLAAYIIDDDLAEKITKIIPGVENINGELRGLMTVTLREELTEAETETLRKELIKQLDNGWGEDFNEETVNIGGRDVYISFLCAKDGERLHVLDNTDDVNQTMGGLS